MCASRLAEIVWFMITPDSRASAEARDSAEGKPTTTLYPTFRNTIIIKIITIKIIIIIIKITKKKLCLK
jgi:hypothetical protein